MKIKQIRIRMYRQGLGDCFLLTLTYEENEKYHILIDCGVILGTENPADIMSKVAQNIKDEVGEKIDAVVITHEHWDHLSGFKQARNIFDSIEFSEVWMAWTEDPENDLANKLRKTREERKAGLGIALDKLRAELDTNQFLTEKQKTSRKAYFNSVEEITSFSGGLGINGNSSTSEALSYVKGKSKSIPFYCKPGSEPFTVAGIEGIRFYVLGPPEDEKLIKKSLSEKEVYHAFFMTEFGNSFMSALNINPGDPINDKYLPFDKYTGVQMDELNIHTDITGGYNSVGNEWRKIDNDWMDFSGQLALALDSDTNNTSLVLAIELIDSGKFLLFPGDAQVGNWLSWYNYAWKVKNKEGKTEDLDIEKIFSRTVFYKVGHHGSHNATLSAKGLDLMNNKELSVMIPVNKEMAKKKRWNMPFPPLFEKLKQNSFGKVIMADEDFVKDMPKPTNISQSEWNAFKDCVDPDSEKLFIDFKIDC